MTQEQVVAYLNDQMGQPVEFKEVNDTLFIKFDFLPFKVREFVHAQFDYDPELMINMERECLCGRAYFYQAARFFNIMKRFKI